MMKYQYQKTHNRKQNDLGSVTQVQYQCQNYRSTKVIGVSHPVSSCCFLCAGAREGEGGGSGGTP